jgi:hypothetical protein
MDILNTYFKLIDIGIAVFIAWYVALLFRRVKFAERILARTPEHRDQLMRTHRLRLLVMKLALWVIPIVTLCLALEQRLLQESLPWAIFVLMAEGMVWTVLQYSFERWLIRYVTEREQTPPASSDG